ncbi:hypothetical protein N9917_00525 [Deltaproteobacteria bacterium]|nr:hypothetical protein [Deltaproteobacteria bacterium]
MMRRGAGPAKPKGRNEARDGIYASTFNDGSGPSFEVKRPGVAEKYGGINERLKAEKQGKPLLINAEATTLRYHRDFGYCSMPFLTLYGDLGRAHYPQKWAKGLLPIIPIERFWVWFNGGPRSVLEFRTPKALEPGWEGVVYAYIFLLMRGWDNGFVSGARSVADFWSILNNVGFVLSQGEISVVLHRLVDHGWATRRSHDSYQSARPADWNDKEGMVDKTKMLLASLSTNFQPFLTVPDISGYNTKATSPLIIQGGWVGNSHTKDRRDR